MKFKEIYEQINYKEIHGHDRVESNTVEWYFHNYEHGYKHCIGSEKNPYKIKHINGKHGINKKYARGHGINSNPQWFKFTKKLDDRWWDLSTGKRIEISEVPKELK